MNTIKFPKKGSAPKDENVKSEVKNDQLGDMKPDVKRSADEVIADILANKHYLIIDLTDGQIAAKFAKPVEYIDIINLLESVKLSYLSTLIRAISQQTTMTALDLMFPPENKEAGAVDGKTTDK